MKVHTAVAIATFDSLDRQDCDVEPNNDFEQLASGCAVVGDIKANIIAMNRQGAAIVRYEVKNIVGIGCLVLGGNGYVEQRFCKKFQQRTNFKNDFQQWCLPIPPLEIVSRPLLYYAVYRMSNCLGTTKWLKFAKETVELVNGAGVLLLQHFCKPQARS